MAVTGGCPPAVEPGAACGISYPGVAGNYDSTPDNPNLHITGPLSIIVRKVGDIPDASGSGQHILGYGTAAGFPWEFRTLGGGALHFRWNDSGTGTERTLVGVGGSGGMSQFDGSAWFGMTFEPDIGGDTCRRGLWASNDGASWTLLGYNTDSPAATIDFGNPSDLVLSIAGHPASNLPLPADLVSVELRDGVGPGGEPGGTLVASRDYTERVESYTDPQGNQWTLQGDDWSWVDCPDGAGIVLCDVDETHLTSPGNTNNAVWTAYDSSFDNTGDLWLAASIGPDLWAPADDQSWMAQNGPPVQTGTTGWVIGLSGPARTFTFTWGDGTDFQTATTDIPTGYIDGTRRAVAVWLDIDDGGGQHVVHWYQSDDDGDTWVEFASETLAGTTTVATAAIDPVIAASGDLSAHNFAGDIYWTEARNGDQTGPVIYRLDFTEQPAGEQNPVDDQGHQWALLGDPSIVAGSGATEFIRWYEPGGGTYDTALDGVTPYVPTGLVGACAGADGTTIVAAGDCVEVTGSGTTDDPYTVAAQVSATADNQVSCAADGLYVPEPPAPPDPTAVQGTDCVDVTGTGTTADPYQVAAVTDGDAAMACGPDGLQAVASGDDNNQVEFGSDGGLYVPPEMRFARLTADQDITATPDTDTAITWDTEPVNNKYGWTTNAFGVVVPVDGVYRVTVRLQMNGFGGATDDVITIRVLRSVTGNNTIERRNAGVFNPYYPSTAILHGAAGEVFSGIVNQNGAGDRTILADTQITVELIQVGTA